MCELKPLLVASSTLCCCLWPHISTGTGTRPKASSERWQWSVSASPAPGGLLDACPLPQLAVQGCCWGTLCPTLSSKTTSLAYQLCGLGRASLCVRDDSLCGLELIITYLVVMRIKFNYGCQRLRVLGTVSALKICSIFLLPRRAIPWGRHSLHLAGEKPGAEG